MSIYSTVLGHQSMVFDSLRNEYYARAIEHLVTSGDVVLDLGAGLGLHGYMAAKAGAGNVYLVEPASVLDVAQKLVDSNDLRDQVTCLSGTIEETVLPEPVDVIISVFTGNFLLTEDLLPSLFYARDKYLKPGGRLIPDRAVMEVAPVCVPDFYAEHIDCWNSELYGTNFDLVRGFAANSLYYGNPESRDAQFLAASGQLLEMDFMTATEASCNARVDVTISEDGTCHGWLGWFNMHLDGQWLSTSPEEKQLHWSQVFLPVAEPIMVKAGDTLSFQLNRPEFGEWTWIVEHEGRRQQQSTFLSAPVSLATMQKKSDRHVPAMSQKGLAMRDVLQQIDGQKSTEDIATRAQEAYPEIFPNRAKTLLLVKNLIEQFS